MAQRHPNARVLLGVATAVTILTAVSRPVENAELGPPLASPLRLTATFGEYRTGHLHAGIDLSTSGEVGVPVLAVDAGSIVRLRAGASGYGRALALATDGGLQALYGHLDHFARSLDDYLRAHQRAQSEYEIDLAIDPGRFRFERGDTIAYSGSTGAGPPHLHFELRESGQPWNPLLRGLRVADCGDPEIGLIEMRALGPRGWVDSGPSATLFLPAESPLEVWGPVGAEAFIVERSGTTTARLAPFSVRLHCDGELVFERRFTRIDFAHDAEVDRIYGQLARDEGPFALRLYLWPLGAEPDETMVGSHPGIIAVNATQPGEHTLCLEVGEAGGFVREASWTVVARPPLIPVDWRAARTGDSLWQLGLRLAEPMDSTRLPMQLVWRSASAPDSGRCEWSPFGDGWFAAPVPARGAVDVRTLDVRGRPVAPVMRVGAETHSSALRARAIVSEGFVTIALAANPPLPELPRGALRAADGESSPLVFRGCSDRGEWLFALEHDRLRGRSRDVALEFPESDFAPTIPLDDLIGLPTYEESDGGAGANAAGARYSVAFGQNRISILSADQALYAPAILRVACDTSATSAWPELCRDGRCAWRASDPRAASLPVHGRPVTIHPSWWPLAAPVTVRLSGPDYALPSDADVPRFGLCRADERGDWAWLGGRAVAGAFEAESARLGLFAIFEDDYTPTLYDPFPAADSTLANSPAQLAVGVTEFGSGFDPRAADIFLDGSLLLAVWDVDTGILAADLDSPAGPGEHHWEVQVRDRAGNLARAAFDFTVAAAR